MKKCPQCGREYDNTMSFCLDDGSELLYGPAAPNSSGDEPATAILRSFAAGQESPTAVMQPPSVSSGEVGASIAVLPFAHLSSDPDDEYFCDGLAEELLNALAKIDGLKVAARTSAFSFKGKDTEISEVGQKLGVRNILEGSVRKSGDRLRITVQLVNASDGYHVWSERYDREMRDIFDVQDEITLAVVDALKVKLLGEVAQIEPPTKDTAAYELYLKGRSLLYQRGLSIAKAIDCFNEAVALDSDYAQAWAGLADGYTSSGYSGYKRATEVMPLALEAARKSLELDTDLAEGHSAFACAAMLYDLDFDLAERAYLRALELNPNYLQARAWYGLFFLHWISGRHADGFEQIKMMLDADPLSSYTNTIACFSCITSGRIPEAVEFGKRGIDLDPKSYLAAWSYSAALNGDEQYEAAVAAAERALAMSGRHSWAMMTLASAYAKWGKMSDAHAVFRELEARSLREHIQPGMLCAMAAVAGEIDKAMEYAKQGIEVRDPIFVMLARTWPDYDNIRTDARFLEIVSHLGLPGYYPTAE
ncbi:MAG: tetratricopeptide repeat protein [Pyrinomonadaceae bacterium]